MTHEHSIQKNKIEIVLGKPLWALVVVFP